MPESGKSSRGPKVPNLTTPEAFPTTAPQFPSGDYSYTVELVSSIQHQLGRLTEAVESLKDQTKEQGAKLGKISQDVHAAKVVIGIVGGFIGLVGIFLGIVLIAAFEYLIRSHFK